MFKTKQIFSLRFQVFRAIAQPPFYAIAEFSGAGKF